MNKKQIIIGVVILLVAVAGIVWYLRISSTMSDVRVESTVPTNSLAGSGEPIDVKNANYLIESREILLEDGVASAPAAPGSASIIRTSVLEGPAFADIDGDNEKDAVVILRDEPGGTGIFYYISTLLTNNGNEKSSNALLLGDRIRIKEISIDPGVISVKILVRKDEEAMAVAPTIEKILKFKVTAGVLVALEEQS